MDKDRKITIVSIIMWAVCIIVLFAYYEIFNKESSNKAKENEQVVNEGSIGSDSESDGNSKYKKKAEQMLESMSISEKVGQMFFVRCPENNAEQIIADYNIGAYILFARDFEGETKDSIKKKISNYQSKAKIPLLIGVDEEGGSVTRVSRFKAFRNEKFPSPQDLYNSDGLNAIQKDTAEKCSFLSELGINVNFAPVCDISTDSDSFIYKRTLGQDAEQTAEYVKEVVHQMNSSNMGSVLKHFPGYGDNKDTHIGSASDERTLEDFREKDFIPFQAGINAGAQCILVAHNIVKCMDSENPASLSSKVHDILRNDLGYKNVIISDDLDMDAIDVNINDKEAAIRAIKAGNDMVVSSNYEEQITAVIDAVKKGSIAEARVNDSVVRILIWKMSLGLM